MDLDQEILSRFICTKCGNNSAGAKRFSAAGTGLSKMFDIQHNVFLAISCNRCGYTELYNPEVLEGKDTLGNILDLLFGR